MHCSLCLTCLGIGTEVHCRFMQVGGWTASKQLLQDVLMGQTTRSCSGDSLLDLKLIEGKSQGLQLRATLVCTPLDANKS